MNIGRYVVLDENGYCLNLILVNIPYPEDYYPGYGRYIVYSGPDPAPEPPKNKNIVAGFTYLETRPKTQMQQGSRMDIITGDVTPPPFVESVDEIAGDFVGADYYVEGLS